MKYIGLCGLHGAGKSHLAEQLSTIAGWPILQKRGVLKGLYDSGWLRHEQAESWESWYRSVYERIGSGSVILKVLESFSGSGPVAIIDAIHTPKEWEMVHSLYPGSILVGVWSPVVIRTLRMDETPEMDARRLHFWHHTGDCLMASVEWAFPGTLSDELLIPLCREFIRHVSDSSSFRPPVQ